MGNEMITLIIDAKNLASKELKGLQKDLRGVKDDTDRAGLAMSRIGNVAKGAIVAGFAMAAAAAAKFAVDSVAAAAEEEKGIAQMTAAIKANVAGWDGNTVAIEDRIEAGKKLSFADDAQRASLARLVAVTGDANKAFGLMRAAMDLARFKGISLEEASVALIKVEGGQYRALKELGIVLETGASQTQALAAVQKVAAGQAVAYADTLAGSSERIKNTFDDYQEELGGKVIPYIDNATMAIGFLDAAMVHSGDTAYQNAWAFQNMDQTAYRAAAAFEETGKAGFLAALGIEKVGGTAADVAQQVKDSNRTIERSYNNLADDILGNYTAKFDSAMGIVEARSDLHNAKTDQDRAGAYAQLAENQALSSKDYDAWLATLGRMAKHTKGQAHKDIDAAIAEVKRLRAAAKNPIVLSVLLKSNIWGNFGARAEGGPVLARNPYVVGEEGPEVFIPDVGGTIIPNDQLAAPGPLVRMPSSTTPAATAGAGGVHLHVNSAYPPSPQQVREMADVLDAEFARRSPRYSQSGR